MIAAEENKSDAITWEDFPIGPMPECRTPEECEAMYAAIPPDLKSPAIALLAETFESNTSSEPPKLWYKSRLIGIALRNLLRARGFDEGYFHIRNLDDIYIPLVEEALKLR
jgi:hypothetical protein